MRAPAGFTILAGEMAPRLTLQSEDRIDSDASAVFAFGIFGGGVALVIALALGAMIRQRRRAAAAARSVSQDLPLRPGPAVLAGVVTADDGQAPVRITITQQGKNTQTKNGWTHSYTEIARRVEVRPFRLLLPSGASVPVEPGEEIFLVDNLNIAERFPGLVRTRVAELSIGERAVVSGELRTKWGDAGGMATAYRGGGGALALFPPARGKVLVSTEPLEKRHLDRARIHFGWAIGFAAFFAFAQLLCLQYHLRLFLGDDLTGVVASKRHYTTRSKNSTTHHYEITARVQRPRGEDVVEVAEDVPSGQWGRIKEGTPIAVLAVPGTSNAQLGREASLPIALVVVTSILQLTLAIVYLVHARTSRPWYEKKKVVDTGSGMIVG
jgi:hypothetical protein